MYNFYLKEPNSNKDTLIIIRSQKCKFKYSTGLKINRKDWDFENKRVVIQRGRSDLKLISLKINEFDNLLTKFIDNQQFNGKEITKDSLKSICDKHRNKESQTSPGEPVYLVECIKEFIKIKLSSGGKSKSWKQKYAVIYLKTSIYDLFTRKNTKMSDLNNNFIDKYVGFLRHHIELINENLSLKEEVIEICNKEKQKVPSTNYNDNTLFRHINFLLTVVNWYNDIYKKDISLKNPVKSYLPDNVHLTDHEISLIENINLNRDSLIKARDIFLIGVYSGQRFSDYSIFEKEDLVKTPNGEMIVKKAEKNELESFIPITKKLKALLEKYDWNIPKISGQKFNPHIKEICLLAGINTRIKKTHYRGDKNVTYQPKYELISSHTARRTFITLSSEKGMPDHIIMKITGIRDIKTLQKYKKTSQSSVEEAMMKIWDN